MNNSGILIAGSFPLQCVYGEDWANDIDMFVPDTDENGNTNSAITDETTNPVCKMDLALGLPDFVDYHAANRYGDILGESITWMRTYAIEPKGSTVEPLGSMKKETYQEYRKKQRLKEMGKKINDENKYIQIIQTSYKSSELWDFIKNNFDFDVVKIAFGFRENKGFVLIDNIDSIIEKKCPFNFSGASVLRRKKIY